MARQPEKRYQRLRKHIPELNLPTDPPESGPLIIPNTVQRVFAYLVGTDGEERVEVGATQDGMEVTAENRIPNRLDVYAGSAADDWSPWTDLPSGTSIVTVFAFSNPLDVQLEAPDGTQGDVFYIPADTTFSMDWRAAAIRWKNNTAGSVADYQILASAAES